MDAQRWANLRIAARRLDGQIVAWAGRAWRAWRCTMFVVAGVTGKTGRVVAESLLQRGERVLVRGERAAAVWRARGAEARVVSLDQATPLSAALRGARGFYTLLPEDPVAADCSGQRRAIVAALTAAVEAARVPHVVRTLALHA